MVTSGERGRKPTMNPHRYCTLLLLLTVASEVFALPQGTVAPEAVPASALQYENHPFEGTESLTVGHPMKKTRRFTAASNTAAESAYAAIRITAYPVEQADGTTAQQDYINNDVVPDAIAFFADTLKVFPVSGKVGRTQFCNSVWAPGTGNCFSTSSDTSYTCGSASVPASHVLGIDQYGNTQKYPTNPTADPVAYTDGGVSSTDVLVYVMIKNTGSCTGSIQATAATCSRDQYDRPILVGITFCPNALTVQTKGTQAYEDMLNLAIHEITHALGFADSNFAYYRDHTNGGQPRTARSATSLYPDLGNVNIYSDSVYLPNTNTAFKETLRGHDVWKLATPKVLETVRAQSGCSTLNGAELEDQGGSPTDGGHWEKRLFMNDFMTGLNSNLDHIFTTMTFALLEDSGWYYPNLASSKITVGGWLNNAGCAAWTNKCLTPAADPAIVANGSPYFCKTSGQTKCTYMGEAKGYCNVATGLTIGSDYQYFTSATGTGGDFETADFCPYVRPYSNSFCDDTSSSGYSSRKTAELWGTTSKCFESTLAVSPGTEADYQACYKFSCSGNTLSIEVGHPTPSPTTVTCTTAGETHAIAGMSGVVTCPSSLLSYCPSNGGTGAPTGTPTGAPTPASAPTTVAPVTAGTPTQTPTRTPTAPTGAPTTGAPTTGAPTTQPTVSGGFTVTGSVVVGGVTREHALLDSFQNAMRDTIAGITGIAASLIALTIGARRTVTVGYTIQAATVTQANTATAAVTTAHNANTIASTLTTHLTGHGYTGAAVTSASASTPTYSSNDSSSSDSSADVLIWVIPVVLLVAFIAAVSAFLAWQCRSQQPAQASDNTNQDPGTSEVSLSFEAPSLQPDEASETSSTPSNPDEPYKAQRENPSEPSGSYEQVGASNVYLSGMKMDHSLPPA